MKVFACTTYNNGKTKRRFVATTSQQKAADLFGMTVIDLHTYGGSRGPETRNKTEMSVALAYPGVVFVADNLRNERIEPSVIVNPAKQSIEPEQTREIDSMEDFAKNRTTSGAIGQP